MVAAVRRAHPRHDPQATGGLHREEREAEGAGEVGDDLPGRRPDHRSLVVAVILWKVIPTFAALFAGLGAELPLPTRVVIWASNTLVRFMPFSSSASWRSGSRCGNTTPPTGAAGEFLSTAWCSAHRSSADHAQDRRRAILRTLATLISSGVRSWTASTSPRGPPQRHRGGAVQATRKSIERGETVSQPLKETRSSRRW